MSRFAGRAAKDFRVLSLSPSTAQRVSPAVVQSEEIKQQRKDGESEKKGRFKAISERSKTLKIVVSLGGYGR